MFYIKRIWSNQVHTPLGRWKIEKCNKRINQRIDLSNEDHCGPCGQYALKKLNIIGDLQNKNRIKDRIENRFSIPSNVSHNPDKSQI
jgi:hypothetical protein